MFQDKDYHNSDAAELKSSGIKDESSSPPLITHTDMLPI